MASYFLWEVNRGNWTQTDIDDPVMRKPFYDTEYKPWNDPRLQRDDIIRGVIDDIDDDNDELPNIALAQGRAKACPSFTHLKDLPNWVHDDERTNAEIEQHSKVKQR